MDSDSKNEINGYDTTLGNDYVISTHPQEIEFAEDLILNSFEKRLSALEGENNEDISKNILINQLYEICGCTPSESNKNNNSHRRLKVESKQLEKLRNRHNLTKTLCFNEILEQLKDDKTHEDLYTYIKNNTDIKTFEINLSDWNKIYKSEYEHLFMDRRPYIINYPSMNNIVTIHLIVTTSNFYSISTILKFFANKNIVIDILTPGDIKNDIRALLQHFNVIDINSLTINIKDQNDYSICYMQELCNIIRYNTFLRNLDITFIQKPVIQYINGKEFTNTDDNILILTISQLLLALSDNNTLNSFSLKCNINTKSKLINECILNLKNSDNILENLYLNFSTDVDEKVINSIAKDTKIIF